MAKRKEEKISDALLKVALGCKTQEVSEEYAQVDGEWVLTKRKKTEKDIPPDLKAVQMLLAEQPQKGVETMEDEELLKEREKLVAALIREEREKAGKEGQGCDELKKTAKKVKKSSGKKRTGSQKNGGKQS